MNDNFLPSRKASSLIGVHPQTLRRWHASGKIRAIVLSNGNRLFDVSPFVSSSKTATSEKVCYCRVSSKKQSDDLNRQIQFMQSKYPKHTIITDIGSGLNWQRRGLRHILEQAMSHTISEVVVAHKDRLSRFAFDLIKFILEKNRVTLVVLDQGDSEENEVTLASDLMSIVTVFASKQHGKRRYTKKNEKD